MSPDQNPSRPAAGDEWTGPLTWTTDPEIGRPGYYALAEDGKEILDPPVLLTHIDLAPDDPEDGDGVWVVADPGKPYFSHAPRHIVPHLTDLEAVTHGTSRVTTE